MERVIVVEKEFSHSDDGNNVNTYSAGEHVVSERCALVAVDQLKVAKYSDKTPEEFYIETDQKLNEQEEKKPGPISTKTTAKTAKSTAGK